MHKKQLEIPLNAKALGRPAQRQQRRRGRAEWWFEQMRQVVDRAIDWSNTPAPRPEQIDLTFARGR